MEPVHDLRDVGPDMRSTTMREWLRVDPTELNVTAVIRFALDEPSNSDREYAVHVLRFFVVHMSIVAEFLRGLLDQHRWTSTEKGLALEGLLSVLAPGELERWVVAHPEPEFLETFILNTDPADWGDVRGLVDADERLAPTTRVPLCSLAADIEAGRV